MKKFIAVIICFLPFIVLSSNPFKGVGILKSEYIYNADEVDFPSCHASTIVETGEGLLAAWFGGLEEGDNSVSIYVASNLKGKWNKPVKVAEGIQDGNRYPCWNPVLFCRDNGDIILYYKVGPSPRTWWGLYKISKDNGKSWSSECKISDNLLGPIKNKPVKLPNSEILYPTSFETTEKWNIYLEVSDQNLQNWRKIEIDNGQYNVIQPTILFSKDGSLLLLSRSKNQNINESWSKDHGKTWSAVVPTLLPNNNSGIDAVTLSSGLHSLVYNPITKGRYELAFAVSKDGKEWSAATLLENDPSPKAEFSYPAIIQTKDGLIHITYTWNRKLIKHVVIDPAGIQTKPLINGNWPED